MVTGDRQAPAARSDVVSEPGAFLTALQLGDSFFPSGMYAHSQGLEAMINRGLVASLDDLEDFLTDQMRWSVLPGDGVALMNAHAAARAGDLGEVIRIDRMLSALRLPPELREASRQLGRRLLAETHSFGLVAKPTAYPEAVERGESPGNGAVAWGVIAQAAGLAPQHALLVFCHGHAVSILGAAMRMLPVSHSDAQQVLRRLHPILIEAVDMIERTPWAEMTAFTPTLDILAICHESDELKMFAS